MKIAYISQAYPPIISGASIMLESLVDGMAKRGHTVLVLVPSDRGNAYIQTYENVRIVRLKSIRNPKRAFQKFVPWSLNVINSHLKDFKPEIIHTHDVLNLGIFGLISGKQLNIPVIATLHQLPGFVSVYLPDFPGLKLLVESLLWRYGRMLNKNFQVMIVPTETVSRTVFSHGGFRPFVISNGIDCHNFCPAKDNLSKYQYLWEKYGLDPELPIILHVGRLDIDKKVDVVIQAAARVMAQIPAQLLIVGDGECLESLMEMSRQLGIAKHSHFPGFVDKNTDLPALYRIATVFTTASEIETQGLVLLEAMASGLPVVAVDATCIHEVIKHGINGYLVSPGNENEIVKGIIDLLRNPIKAKQMGEAGLSIVQAHSSNKSIDKHEMLYSNVLQQHQPVKGTAQTQSYIIHGKH
jgi:glycosyltransferase involved in cell wall biosynthesis